MGSLCDVRLGKMFSGQREKNLMLAQDRGLSTAQDQTLLYITSNNIIPLDYELSIAWRKISTHYLSLIFFSPAQHRQLVILRIFPAPPLNSFSYPAWV